MPTDLERIEEKHRRGKSWCRSDDCLCLAAKWPCDVVKLARALDDAAAVLRRQGWPTCAAKAERTLREVAGGER